MMKDLNYIDQEHQELKQGYDILTKKIFRLTERWSREVEKDS